MPERSSTVLPTVTEARLFVIDVQVDQWDHGWNEPQARGLAGLLADIRLLTYASHLVLRKKTENHPGIPGVDQVTRQEFLDSQEACVPQLQEQLRSGIYRPLPLRKHKRGRRVLQVRCWCDRVVEQAIVLLLEPLFRCRFHDGALGWRNGCNQAMAVDRVISALRICNFVVLLDIFKCFENIRHADVMSALREVVRDAEFNRVIKSLLVTGVAGQALKDTDIHQGTTLAPLLANIVLSQIDHAFAPGWGVPKNHGHTNSADAITADKPMLKTTATATATAKNPRRNYGHNSGHNSDPTKDYHHDHDEVSRGSSRAASSSSASPMTEPIGRRIGPAPLCLYTRYGDDIVVLVQGSRVQAEQVKGFIEAGLLDLGLRLSEKKTSVGSPEKGFTFLGLDIRLAENGDLVKLVAQHKIEEWAGYLRKKIRKKGLGWRYEEDVMFKQKLRYFDKLGADMQEAMHRLRAALEQC